MKFKLETQHHEDCFTEGNTIRFCVLDRDRPEDWGRRRNGSRGGSTLFWRFACNDPKCPATALVRWDAIAEFVTAGVANP